MSYPIRVTLSQEATLAISDLLVMAYGAMLLTLLLEILSSRGRMPTYRFFFAVLGLENTRETLREFLREPLKIGDFRRKHMLHYLYHPQEELREVYAIIGASDILVWES